MARCRNLCLFAGLVWASMIFVSATLAADPEAEQAVPQPSEAEIATWIEQLDSDKFLLRETATQKLITASSAAIEPLADAVRTGSLEKAFRCIHVLRAFAVGDDIETEINATSKLITIAEAHQDRISDYAGDVLKKIEPLQRERAIRILSGLGVKFTSYSQPQRFMAELDGPGIVIDDSYQGTVDQLYYLRHLTFIEDVQISNEKVTADWFSAIAKMPNVKLMTIKDGPVDIDMLRELEPILPHLQAIRLYYLDVKGEDLAPLFAKMVNLQRAEIFGLDLNDKEEERIKSVVPMIASDKIEIRRGGFLGVHGSVDLVDGPCVIQNVNQDSGAYKAGLRGGDRVTMVDGNQVDSFTHLIDLLRNKKVGDKIEMEAIRDGVTKKLDITLGKWPMRQGYR